MGDETKRNGASADDAIDKTELEPMTSASPASKDDKNNNDDAGNKDENSVGELLEEFAGGTSLPGVPRAVGAPSRISRIFWIIVIVTCVIMFFWGISDLFKLYFSYPKKVTVEMVSEPVPFPSVTICNMRSLNFDVLNRINDIFLNQSSYANQTFDDEPFIGQYLNFTAKISHMWSSPRSREDRRILLALDESVTRTALFAEITDEVLLKASIQAEQYVAICSMGGAKCDVTRDFQLFFHAYYFNCYTYDASASSKKAKTIMNIKSDTVDDKDVKEELPWLTPGLDNGLSMVLLTGSGMLKKNEEIRFIPGLYDTGSATAGGDGVRVIIHDPGVSPFPLSEGFDVPPGFSASFGVKPRRNVRIGQPHGDCRNEPIKVGDVELEYRQLVCQQVCVQNYIVEKCGCFDETLPCQLDEKGPPTCHNSAHFPAHCQFYADDACYDALLLQYTRVECSREVREKVRLNRSMIAECSCRPNCEELVYEVSYSVSEWPANGFEGDAALRDILEVHNFAHGHFTEAQVEQLYSLYEADRWQFMRDFARINVYVADPEVLVTTESPEYETSQLISDIGGQLGVWIGLSLITLAEIVELLGQLFNRLVLNRCRRRHNKQTSSAA